MHSMQNAFLFIILFIYHFIYQNYNIRILTKHGECGS